MEGTRKLLVDKIQQVVTNLGGEEEEGEQGWGPQPGECVGDFFLKQLHYLLHLLAAFWAFLVDKFNQVLPPETRDETLHKWAHIGLTRVLPIGLALLVFYWCCRLALLVFPWCCRTGCRMIGGAGRMMIGGAGRMMRAPGRMGVFMLRATFEAAPRAYFRSLRA